MDSKAFFWLLVVVIWILSMSFLLGFAIGLLILELI